MANKNSKPHAVPVIHITIFDARCKLKPISDLINEKNKQVLQKKTSQKMHRGESENEWKGKILLLK